MSQQTNMTIRVSGDESAPQGMSLSLEEYLKREDTLADRLLKGAGGTSERLEKLQGQLNTLSATVANGQNTTSQGGHHQ